MLDPLPYGYAYDVLGNYQQALIMSMIFPMLGVVAAILATRPTKA